MTSRPASDARASTESSAVDSGDRTPHTPTPLASLFEQAITHTLSWHPSEAGPSYADARKQALDLFEPARAAHDDLVKALENIAGQKLGDELGEESREQADFEGGYDALVLIARAALAKAGAS